MEELTLEVKNLTKNFDRFTAVDNVSFDIKKGEIVGLLGPNGAGKTTTIMMLLGLTSPTKGEVKVFGLDLNSNREKILKDVNFSSAYVFLLDRLTVFENLYVFSCLYGVSRAKEKIKKILADFELQDLENKLTGNLSSGQLTRLNLCKALLNEPKLLLLDEPTSSLDPEIALKVREILCKMRNENNISILYTSHNMEEIAEMCDRVIFLNQGKIVASDTPLNLARMIKDTFLILNFDAPLEKVKNFCLKKKLNFQILRPNVLELTIKEEEIGLILTQLAREEVLITHVAIRNPDLSDVFLKIARQKNELL